MSVLLANIAESLPSRFSRSWAVSVLFGNAVDWFSTATPYPIAVLKAIFVIKAPTAKINATFNVFL